MAYSTLSNIADDIKNELPINALLPTECISIPEGKVIARNCDKKMDKLLFLFLHQFLRRIPIVIRDTLCT